MSALQKYEFNNYYTIAEQLTSENIILLAKGEIMAIQVKNFYPKDIAEKATKRVNHNGVNYYLNAPDIGRVGMAFYETDLDPNIVNQYYAIAMKNLSVARKIFSPYLSPIDKLRLDLQEIWISGANIENLHDKKMFVGLFRKIEAGVSMLPHRDDVRVDSGYSLKSLEIEGQIAANIYLQMPHHNGGDLELWDLTLSENEFNELREPGSYGITRDKLPAPTCIVRPEVGDLVLFNARRIHAVSQSPDDERLSVSCFIGYRDRKQPLTYWS